MSAEAAPLLLGDGMLGRVLPMGGAVAVMERALAASAAGTLASPPRLSAPLAGGELVFTAGASAPDGVAGFRAYLAPEPHAADQVTVAWDAAGGRVLAVYVGRELGEWRTGALGGAAIGRMAAPGAASLAVIGTGRQAWTQALAALAVRPLVRVRVYSRRPDARRAFAARLAAATGAAVRAAASAEEAVADADVVVTATDSGQPVLRAEWIRPGTHLNHVGPKRAGHCELPLALYGRAGRVATDAPAQLRALGAASALSGHPVHARVAALAALPAGAPDRRADEITVYHSLGLAGTEVLLAHHLADRLRHPPLAGSSDVPFPSPTETFG